MIHPSRSYQIAGPAQPDPELSRGGRHSKPTDRGGGAVATLCRGLPFSRGNGDGTFAGPFTLTTLHNPQQVAAGDFDQGRQTGFAVMGTDSTGENSGKSIQSRCFPRSRCKRAARPWRSSCFMLAKTFIRQGSSRAPRGRPSRPAPPSPRGKTALP